MSASTQPSRARQFWKLLESALGRFGRHHLFDWAAALTYYSMLSIFPALIVLISALGVAGQDTIDSLLANLDKLAPGPVRDLFIGAIEELRRTGTSAGLVLAVSLGAALWSASAYIGAFTRASNIVWEVRDAPPFPRTIPRRLAITGVMLSLLSLIGLIVVATGPLASNLRQLLGLDEGSIVGNGALRWPLLIALMVLLVGILFNLAPNKQHRGVAPVSLGSLLAIALWGVGTVVFTAYVASFGSFNKTYGSLAGVVIFLVWLWLSNVALLLGLELDAEVRRYKTVHGRSPFSRRGDAPRD
ncbi:MAG: YihY/virulence factor BrkB family protein [Actinobacteria bacterium]|nr:YihY/virulence factor BrkB family protein [Actinomycetota bacterium]